MNKIQVVPLTMPNENDLKLITNAAKLTQVFDFSFKDSVNYRLLSRLIDMGHWAPFEFADFTVFINGCSRVFLAQICRHRLASYMSSSQQYQDHSNFDYVIPNEIEDLENYQNVMSDLKVLYVNELQKSNKDAARYLLPNACRVNLMMKANFREWLSVIIPQRICKRNTPETIIIMKKIAAYFPFVLLTGPPCLTEGACNQGKMCCKSPYKDKSELCE